jgi:menaquinone-9 beta-reductase
VSGSPLADAAHADLAIVGAGIAGGALAAAAARAGLNVLLLERTVRHEDRVRGEYMPAWGVREATSLGVLDVFLAAGGNWVRRHVAYGEDVPPAAAERGAIQLDRLIPGIQGALTFGHPQVCSALNDAAVAAGAVLLRGVTEVEVSPGSPPTLSFNYGTQKTTLRPRLIVAADGRGSRIARAIGAEVQSEQAEHLLCGLLVDGAEEWPQDHMSIGTEGELVFYVFPQGAGRVRLYAAYSEGQRGRFSGPGNAQRLLDAFRFESVPGSAHLAGARAIGPCHGYPGGDTWIAKPGADGVVLIGDAAGHNCPSIGQGVTIAMRDARHVLEALANGGWSSAAFDAYAEERAERLRRLRFVAQLFRELRGDFTPAGRARRQRVREKAAADPSVMRPILASQLGPFSVPPETFTASARDRLLS